MSALIVREQTGHGTAPGLRFKPSPEREAEVQRNRLPADARDYVDPCTLALWIQDEVESAGTWVAPPDSAGRNAPPAAMLTLLTFAYATNVLESNAINLACKSDPAFRFLCGGRPPFPEEITSFRRRHRLELESLLTRVFGRLLSHGDETFIPGVYLRLSENVRERLDIARQLDDVD